LPGYFAQPWRLVLTPPPLRLHDTPVRLDARPALRWGWPHQLSLAPALKQTALAVLTATPAPHSAHFRTTQRHPNTSTCSPALLDGYSGIATARSGTTYNHPGTHSPSPRHLFTITPAQLTGIPASLTDPPAPLTRTPAPRVITAAPLSGTASGPTAQRTVLYEITVCPTGGTLSYHAPHHYSPAHRRALTLVSPHLIHQSPRRCLSPSSTTG
jgi:hypothetical protein